MKQINENEKERKRQQEEQEELYKEQARKICLEKNIETTDDELETFAALFCAKNSKEFPMDLTKFKQQTKHVNELIDKLDNEYKGNINDIVENSKYNTNTEILKTNTDYNFVDNFPLKIDSIYVNEEDLRIIYVKSISPSKITKEIECVFDEYRFNNEEEYVLYKNEYYTYDFSDLWKNYTIEQLKLYREISKEEVNNVVDNIKIIQDNIKEISQEVNNIVNNIKIMQDNINKIKKQFKNLLKKCYLYK